MPSPTGGPSAASRRLGRRSVAALCAWGIGLLGMASIAPPAQAIPGAITVDLSSTTVSPGASVTSVAKMPVSSQGVISQSVTQTFDPTVAKLTGPDDVTAPADWTVRYSTDGSTFSSTAPTTAAGWAAVRSVKAEGSLVSQGEYQGRQIASETSTMALPASGPFSSTGATGDGGGLFFSEDGYVFNIYHHETIAGIMCHTRTGATCSSNWPYSQATGINAISSDYVTMGWIDDKNDHLWRAGNRTYEMGFECIDIADIRNPRPCGPDGPNSFIATGPSRSPIAGTPNFGSYNTWGQLVGIEQVGGRLFAITGVDGPLQLLCVDTQARGGLGAVCPGYPQVLKSDNVGSVRYGSSGINALHGKLFVSVQGGFFTCWDPATNAMCTGRWPLTVSMTGTTAGQQRHIFELPTASGGYSATCVAGSNAPIGGCFDDTGRPVEVPSGLRSWFEPISGLYTYYNNEVSRVGSRLYTSNGTGAAAGGYVTCFDMSLNNGLGAVCPFFPWNVQQYSVHPDPLNANCIWTNNHTNVIRTFDVTTGTQGCLTPPSEVVIPAATAVPRMACAPSSSGVHEWRSIQLQAPLASEYTSATLTVQDSYGLPIAGWRDLPITGSRIVDLSTLPVSSTGQKPNFVVKFDGLTSVGNVSVKVEVVGDAPELCLSLQAVAPCPTVSGVGLMPNSVPAAPTSITGSGTASTTSGTTSLTPDTEVLTSTGGADPACGGTLQGTATTSDSARYPIPNAVVTLLSSTGTVLTYPVGHPQAGQPITATTDANGDYAFPTLAPGSYKVRFVNAGSSVIAQSRLIKDSRGDGDWSTSTTASGTPRAAVSLAATVNAGGVGVINGYYSSVALGTSDTTSGYEGQTQTKVVTANDIAATGQTMTATSVYLCAPGTVTFTAATCTLRPTQASPLVVAGEGSYWLNPTTGTVSFLPIAGFTGTATALNYIAQDSASNLVNSTYTPTVLATPAAPTANPDTTVGIRSAAQTATLYANDQEAVLTTFTASSTRLCNPNTTPAQTAPNCTATTVTVTGVGTYSLATATGIVTFTPVSTFTGTAPALGYQVTDSLGRTANSTYTPTVVGTPTASPDTSTGAFNTAQSINAVSNDAASTGTVMAPSTLRLCSSGQTSPNCTATSVTVSGQGTYSVNTATGIVTFTPLATFTGTASAQSYQVADAFGQVVTSTITPTVTPPALPTLVADTSSGLQGVAQTQDLDSNDTAPAGVTLTTSSMRLCNSAATPAQTPPNCTATTVVVSGEGRYSLNTTTGVVTFTPCSASNVPSAIGCTGPFLGVGAGVTYQITDSLSRVSSTTYKPTVVGPPSATADTSTGAYETAQTISPLANDSANGSTFVPSTVKICTTATATASCSGTSLSVAGQGTYVVNADGTVTFTPIDGYRGTGTAIKYVVTTAAGAQTTSTITPTVSPPPAPSATPETATVAALGQVPFSTITGSGGLATGTGLVTSGASATCISASAALTSCGTSVTTADGTWSINQATGVVTYTNTDGTPTTTSAKAPVYYRVTDEVGQTASAALTPVVPSPPAATNDTSSGPINVSQVITVLANDSAAAQTALDASSVRLCATGVVPPNCSSTSITVSGEGTYTVNANGSVTFAPVTGFTGTATPVTYQVADLLGQKSGATITPSITGPVGPTAASDAVVVAPGGTATFRTITGAGGLATAGTGALVPGSTCLIDPANASSCSASITVAGVGTYTLNTTTGVVTLVADPAATSGAKTSISYRVTDVNGLTATSTLTPTVPSPPVATNDRSYGESGHDQSIVPAGNDASGSVSAPLDATSVRLCNSPTEVAPTCASTTVTNADGIYVVNPSTGVITFTPSAALNAAADSVMATASPVTYVVSDSLGQKATATIRPNVLPKPAPVAVNDTGSAAYGQSVTLTPLANDTAGTTPAATTTTPSTGVTEVRTVTNLAYGTLRLCAANETPPNCTQNTVTTVDGTYTLSGTTVTFAPTTGFTGTVTTPVQYQVANTFDRSTQTTTVATVGVNPAGTCVPSSCSFTQPDPSVQSWETTTVSTSTTAGTPSVSAAYLIPTIGAPSPPAAVADTKTTSVNTSTTITPLTNDTVGQAAAYNAASLRLCGSGETAPNCSSSSVVVSGKGTFILDPATSIVTFVPAPDFTGAVDPVTYVVADTRGTTTSSTITVTVTGPTATADTSTGLPGVAQTLSPFSNDAPSPGTGATITASSVRLCSTGQTAPACTGTTLTTVDGAYAVNTSTGVVTFTPASTFTGGDATAPVTYVIADSTGAKTSSTLTPHVLAPPTPTAVNDTGSAVEGQSVVFTPVAGTASTAQADSAGTAPAARGGVSYGTPALAATSVRLCQGAQVAPDCAATSVTTVEGTYTVDTGTGRVTFAAVSGFTGTAQYPVRYQVTSTYTATDGSGTANQTRSTTATLTPTIVPIPSPVGVDDSDTGPYGTPLVFEPWDNDSAVGSGSSGTVTRTDSGFSQAGLRLCDVGEDPLVPGACTATSITVAEGTYTVATDGKVTFTPNAGFSGTATSVDYQMPNSFSLTESVSAYASSQTKYATASITPTILPFTPPSAIADSHTTTVDTPVTVEPYDNDVAGTYPLSASTTRLCDPLTEVAPTCASSTVTLAQGTFEVDVNTGYVTFTPASGWTGAVSIDYVIADTQGNMAHSIITVVIPSASSGVSAPTPEAPAVSPPRRDDASEPDASALPEGIEPEPRPAAGPALEPQQDATVVNPRRPVLLDPLEDSRPSPGETFRPSTVRIWDGSEWVRKFTEPGVGTWTVVDGEVEFMPAPGFTGEAVVRVMATDTGGATAKSRLRVMVRPRIIDGSPSSPTRIPGDVPSSIDAGRVRTPVTCPSPLVGGEPIAWITANGVTVPITRVSYPRGGVLEPPPTNQAAGVSARHASLDSTMGTSVLTWHVRYGPGCDGALNGLLRMREGDTFTIRTKAGTTRYEISGRADVAKGDYRPSWFGQAGPHRLSLFTCSDLRNGEFTKTTAIFAKPATSPGGRAG